MVPYMNEFNPSFDALDHIDDDFINDEKSDRTAFHDLV